jgi:hypothetical protein
VELEIAAMVPAELFPPEADLMSGKLQRIGHTTRQHPEKDNSLFSNIL